MYCPPAHGLTAASSPYRSAPIRVITVVTSDAPISRAGDPTPRLMSAGTRKMPDPIIDPTTMAVALNNPRLATSPGFGLAAFFSTGADVVNGELTCPTFLLENCEKVFRCLSSAAPSAKNRANHRNRIGPCVIYQPCRLAGDSANRDQGFVRQPSRTTHAFKAHHRIRGRLAHRRKDGPDRDVVNRFLVDRDQLRLVVGRQPHHRPFSHHQSSLSRRQIFLPHVTSVPAAHLHQRGPVVQDQPHPV